MLILPSCAGISALGEKAKGSDSMAIQKWCEYLRK